MTSSAEIYAGKFRLVLFDVDGVLTNGSLTFDSNGESLKTFNVRDGLAIALLRAHGIRSGVLSGRTSAPLDFRVHQLGLDVAETGSLDKKAALSRICQREDIAASQIAYVGDDVVDLPLVGLVGRFYAPSDAHQLVLERADYVLSSRGGGGVAREAAEHLLVSDGGLNLDRTYQPLIDQWGRFDAVQ